MWTAPILTTKTKNELPNTYWTSRMMTKFDGEEKSDEFFGCLFKTQLLEITEKTKSKNQKSSCVDRSSNETCNTQLQMGQNAIVPYYFHEKE